jgi:hypothetical protein
MIWRVILAYGVPLAVLGAIFALAPTPGRAVDIGAGVFALATWIVPPLVVLLSPKPRTSLAAVGRTIGLVVTAAYLSAAGLVLALLTFAFAAEAYWAWRAVIAIVLLWVSLGVALVLGDRRRPPPGASAS